MNERDCNRTFTDDDHYALDVPAANIADCEHRRRWLWNRAFALGAGFMALRARPPWLARGTLIFGLALLAFGSWLSGRLQKVLWKNVSTVRS